MINNKYPTNYYTVKYINQEILNNIKRTIKTPDNRFWIKGEVINARQNNGHLYFRLKEDNEVIEAVFWQVDNKIKLKEGDMIFVYGRLSTFTTQSKYQIICDDYITISDEVGLTQSRKEKLYKKLNQEGLFNQETKKTRPQIFKRIAIVTSKSGDALQDILYNLDCPFLQEVVIFDTRVQGENTASFIINAINNVLELNKTEKFDALILTRGGGSVTDLDCFNNENLVRFFKLADIFTISAIGHEKDILLCDLVADLRCSTPTAAAKAISPNKLEIKENLENLAFKINNNIHNKILKTKNDFERLKTKLQMPLLKIIKNKNDTNNLKAKLDYIITRRIAERRNLLTIYKLKLDNLNPYKPLQRGYAILLDENNKIIKTKKSLKNIKIIKIKLLDGEISVQKI